MHTHKYLLLPTIALISVVLSGCPIASLPTKEEQPPANSGASTQPQPPKPSSSGQSSASSDASKGPTASANTPGKVRSSSAGNTRSGATEGEPNQAEQTEDPLLDVSQSNPDEQTVADQGSELPGQQQEPDLTDTEPMASNTSDNEQEPDLTDEEVASASTNNVESNRSEQAASSATDSGASASPSSGAATTAIERISILDHELARSAGRFDQMILRERENIRASAKSKGGTTAVSGSEEFESLEDSANASGTSEASPDSVQGDKQTRGSRAGTDQPAQVATYAPPVDIPDGNDDDVVARQLREAAMREPEPKLREKLWEEYRKYKGVKR